MLRPTHFCPNCKEWYFAIYAPHNFWKIYPVLPKTDITPLRLLLCPADGHGLIPWLIDFDSQPKEIAG